MNDSTIAAFENYKTYLEQELKPKADGDFALGSDLFAKRMAYGEMVDIPPDRLLDIAYAQLHKDQGALSEAAREVDPTAPIEAVLKETIRRCHDVAPGLNYAVGGVQYVSLQVDYCGTLHGIRG